MSKPNGNAHPVPAALVHGDHGASHLAPAGVAVFTQEDDTGGSLDQIRDILFGAQVREGEKRFLRLEERTLRELSEMREESRRRYEALESAIRKELEALSERLHAERDARLDAIDALGKEQHDSSAGLQRRLGGLEEQSSKALRELRQQLAEQMTRVSAELGARSQELLERVSQTIGELRDEKAGRAALASLFGELALRLHGASSPEVPK